MGPKALELPQEPTVGEGKACYLVSIPGRSRHPAPGKRSHTVLTISQTTLQDRLEFRQTDRLEVSDGQEHTLTHPDCLATRRPCFLVKPELHSALGVGRVGGDHWATLNKSYFSLLLASLITLSGTSARSGSQTQALTLNSQTRALTLTARPGL